MAVIDVTRVASRVRLLQADDEVRRKLALAEQMRREEALRRSVQFPPIPISPGNVLYEGQQPSGGGGLFSDLGSALGNLGSAIGGGYSRLNRFMTGDVPSPLETAETWQRRAVEPMAGRAITTGRGVLENPLPWQIQPRLRALGQAVAMPEPQARQEYLRAPLPVQLGTSALVDPLMYTGAGVAGEAISRFPYAAAAIPKVPSLGEVTAGIARQPLFAAGEDLARVRQPVSAARKGVPKAAEELAEEPTYVGRLRDLPDVEAEVVTSKNPLVQAAVARTGINPAIAETTPVGRALTARARQQIASEELTKTAMSGIDQLPNPFQIDDMGQIRNIRATGGQSRMWQDVFSKAESYALTPEQQRYVQTYRQIVAEREALRLDAGLEALGSGISEKSFYIPRQVKTIRGIELRKPSSPKLQRIYEEAQEGLANGVRYDNNPRATLELHVRSAYREVLDKQFSEAMEPLSIAPSELVPKRVVAALEKATSERQGAQKTLRAAQRKLTWWRAGSKWRGKLPKQQTGKWGAELTRLTQERDTAKAALEATKPKYWQAKNAYTKALESAKHREVAPGRFWGPDQPDEIPVAMWRNRYFPRADADKLAENLGSFGVPVRKAGVVQRGFEVVGDTIRFAASVGDFALPFIHLLPTLFRNPVVWARATARHYAAFLTPRIQSRYIVKNIETFKEMARYGIPIGDPEFFAALETGRMPAFGAPLEKAGLGKVRQAGRAVGKQTFGRFQASYNTGLGVARAELWKAMKGKMPDNELAAYIRNMTGGLDTRALGVSPNQRALESTWLAFSPRLLRSTVALMGDAMKGPLDPRGQEALRSLASLVAGTTLTYALVGKALGRSDSEIAQGLNPLNGKKFLAYQINNDWIGVGGQVRAITQLVGGLIASAGDLSKLTNMSVYENPLLQFYTSRGAMGTKIAGAVSEAATGGKMDMLPYEVVDSPLDLVKHLGSSALPFTIQGILEGENPMTAMASLLGARTQAESRPEKRKRVSLEELRDPKTGQPIEYEAAPPQLQDEFRARHPDLFAGAGDFPGGSAEQRLVQLRADETQNLAELREAVETGTVPTQEYGKRRGEIVAESSILRGEYAGDYESDNPWDQAMSEWATIISRETAATPGGALTAEDFGRVERLAERELGPEKWQLVMEHRMASADPMEREYLQDRAAFQPYWELGDELWGMFRSAAPELAQFPTYEDFYDYILGQFEGAGLPREVVIATNLLDKSPLLKGFTSKRADVRNAWLLTHPDLAAKGLRWGWIEDLRQETVPAVVPSLIGE